MKIVEYYASAANGTTDPRDRPGSKKKCACCGAKFSFWDDLQMRPEDTEVQCAKCKGITIELIKR